MAVRNRIQNHIQVSRNLDQLLNKNPNPSVAALISLLKLCGRSKALSDGRLVHGYIVRQKYDHDTVLGNWLVQMYGDCGSMDEALAVFKHLPNPNLYSWTMLMKGYAKNGCGREALECFRNMQLNGIEADYVAYVCALEACAILETIEEGQQIHATIVKLGFEGQVVVGTALISMYGKCGSLDNARHVFSRMPHRNVVSWNAMIAAFAQNGYGKEALCLFNWMQYHGFRPDQITFVCALDACAGLTALAEGQVIHTAVVGCGYEGNVTVGTALVNMYGKCGDLEDARGVFDKMPHRNVVSWNAMISAYTQNGHGKVALDLYYSMQSDGLKPDHITFVCALDACGSLADLEEGKKIHARTMENGYDRHVGVGTALISMYGRCKSVEDARNVFSRLSHVNLICWNAMITVCAQNRRGKEALEMFNQMQSAGIKPDQITFVSVLDACTSLLALEKGHEFHAIILERGFGGEVILGNALINMYGKCGSLAQARDVFEKMPCRNAVSWNAIITVCAQNGHDKETLDLFHQMQSNNIKPDHVTFLSVLTACSHTGRIDEGRLYFQSMNRDYGLLQNVEHYVSLLDALGRAGDLDDAEDLITKAPLENKAKLWLCLLGACRLHGDVERGLRAASNVLTLDPANAVAYVLLSNIYAEADTFTLQKNESMMNSR
ncbi:hypothetical protein O6H91_06G016700 [Diphasiastrum complanatum]|uniref:Uncharacterized protein n=1 Tax=Diphasiastrum complanatum TaxID=34168 RepID=A0ACC2DB10_DIPCM|nr:hypothetical protein O6H91_06G016700 [Diphasiastrum complanatum]